MSHARYGWETLAGHIDLLLPKEDTCDFKSIAKCIDELFHSMDCEMLDGAMESIDPQKNSILYSLPEEIRHQIMADAIGLRAPVLVDSFQDEVLHYDILRSGARAFILTCKRVAIDVMKVRYVSLTLVIQGAVLLDREIFDCVILKRIIDNTAHLVYHQIDCEMLYTYTLHKMDILAEDWPVWLVYGSTPDFGCPQIHSRRLEDLQCGQFNEIRVPKLHITMFDRLKDVFIVQNGDWPNTQVFIGLLDSTTVANFRIPRTSTSIAEAQNDHHFHDHDFGAQISKPMVFEDPSNIQIDSLRKQAIIEASRQIEAIHNVELASFYGTNLLEALFSYQQEHGRWLPLRVKRYFRIMLPSFIEETHHVCFCTIAILTKDQGWKVSRVAYAWDDEYDY